MRLTEVMTELYSYEINCGVSSFFDRGFDVWIGDDINGRRYERTFTAEEIEDGTASMWLLHKAGLD